MDNQDKAISMERCNGCVFNCYPTCLLSIGNPDVKFSEDCKYYVEKSSHDLTGDMVVCPFCGHESDNGDYEIYDEGTYAVNCNSCDMPFTVSISYQVYCESKKNEEIEMENKSREAAKRKEKRDP